MTDAPAFQDLGRRVLTWDPRAQLSVWMGERRPGGQLQAGPGRPLWCAAVGQGQGQGQGPAGTPLCSSVCSVPALALEEASSSLSDAL